MGEKEVEFQVGKDRNKAIHMKITHYYSQPRKPIKIPSHVNKFCIFKLPVTI